MGLLDWLWKRETPAEPGEGPTEADDARQVDEAVRQLQSGAAEAALALLEGVVARTPADYRHEFERGGKLHVKFWDMMDFLGYVAWLHATGHERDVVWVLNAYPRAHFYLGNLAALAGDLAGAVAQFDRGLALEDSPRLKCEKAQTLIRQSQHGPALALYDEVLAAPGFLPDACRALALRGRGSVLIELGDRDGAEAAFRASQALEPDSPVAASELAYLARQRGEGAGEGD